MSTFRLKQSVGSHPLREANKERKREIINGIGWKESFGIGKGRPQPFS